MKWVCEVYRSVQFYILLIAIIVRLIGGKKYSFNSIKYDRLVEFLERTRQTNYDCRLKKKWWFFSEDVVEWVVQLQMIQLKMIFFCECSSEGWRSPIALTFEPITKIWRAHILQSKPFNISLEKYVRYLNFYRFDKIFSPKKTIDKKEKFLLNENDVHPTLDSPRKKSGRITCGAALTLLWSKSNCF